MVLRKCVFLHTSSDVAVGEYACFSYSECHGFSIISRFSSVSPDVYPCSITKCTTTASHTVSNLFVQH